MDAEGLNPSGPSGPCGFDSHPGHVRIREQVVDGALAGLDRLHRVVAGHHAPDAAGRSVAVQAVKDRLAELRSNMIEGGVIAELLSDEPRA